MRVEGVTELLGRLREGDGQAHAELYERAYGQLRRIAANHLKHENVGHTLQPTALVHEAWFRLSGRTSDFSDSAHFFKVASAAMRVLLVDHARRKRATKHGGGLRVEFEAGRFVYEPNQPEALIALDRALERLARMDARKCQVVEMRFFAGLSEEAIAKALGVSLRTVKRDWAFAKAWLYDQVG